MNTFFSKMLPFVAIIILFASCDKEYNNIGADIIDDDHYGYEKYTAGDVVAYTQKTGVIQSNNLEINQLGVYTNAKFGTTIASFATQLQLATNAPTFVKTSGIVATSVILEIPYFSKISSANTAAGSYKYVLDSIAGNRANKIKLSVYQSGFELLDLGLDTKVQPYFSNDYLKLDAFYLPARLNNSGNTSENDAFFFDNTERSTTTTVGTNITTTYRVPSMMLTLDNQFGTNILNAGATNLLNDFNFKQFIKGIYFKVEKIAGNDGALAMLNFRKGTITINYKDATSVTDSTPIDKSIILNLTGNSVNVLESPSTGSDFENLPNKGNDVAGDQNLYLKGGNGSVAYIDLFKKDNHGTNGIGAPNGISDIQDIKNSGWLINEANLVFNVNQSEMAAANIFEPNRICIYDTYTNLPIIDYFYDNTTNTIANSGKYVHGGLAVKATTANGGRVTKYKIRLTNYIRNLIATPPANGVATRLGVAVCQSPLNTISSKTLLDNNILFPSSSVMNPLGTILYGSNATVPLDKRLKLEIWYTKPN